MGGAAMAYEDGVMEFLETYGVIAFLQGYRNEIFFILGLLLLVGAVRNWHWVCDPLGTRVGYIWGRTVYRWLVGGTGILLMVFGAGGIF